MREQPFDSESAVRAFAFYALTSLFFVAGCGSGGSTATPPPPQTYSIGGTISGLSNSGLVLQDNAGDNLTVAANANTFTFATSLAGGSTYKVTILTQPFTPSAQICTVGNGAGTVASAAVTNVQVACSTVSATAQVNWTEVHQIIDGFGASDAFLGPMSAANQNFFFGTADGQLGLSILRTDVPNNGDITGDCSTVNSGCAGPYVSDMQAAVANGAKIYSSPWSPPAAYTTNGLTTCTNNSGLDPADYSLYATWLANYVQSLQQNYSITLDALSVQNEPNECTSYDSAVWDAQQIDTFVAQNLGPTFATDNLTTLLLLPEGSGYNQMSLGSVCAGDPSCNPYVGGVNWHDYDASLSGTNTIAADPYPTFWPAGKKYWETEASCGPGFGPNFCESGFNTDMTDALDWAAVIDQRIAVDGANAWLYWWLIDANSSDDQGLMSSNGTVAQRAYVLGQYSRFVRPGYFRIDATHLPNANVSVSAYQNLPTNTLVIVATNYSSAEVALTVNIANAPAFSTLTPYTTSATLNLAQQPSVSVSSNAFTYALPPNSITTFVGAP